MVKNNDANTVIRKNSEDVLGGIWKPSYSAPSTKDEDTLTFDDYHKEILNFAIGIVCMDSNSKQGVCQADFCEGPL